MRFTAAFPAVAIALLGYAPAAEAQQTLDLSGLWFWVERADVVRGPEGYGEDNYYTSYQIDPGRFRNFTSNACWLLADNPRLQGQTLTKIVECRDSTPWPAGHPDHLITTMSCDAHYNEETVAGYSYPTRPANGNSVEIYRCSSTANGTHWVSTSSSCDGQGKSEKSPGWILTK